MPTVANPHRLSLVAPGEELSGEGPPEFERFARRARPGSEDQVALLNLCLTLSQHAVRSAVPPSGRELLQPAFALLRSRIAPGSSGRKTEALQKQRALVFASVGPIEKLTTEALRRAGATRAGGSTPLSEHAELTAERYCRLAAHHATAAVCHTIDVATDPSAALEVPGDVAGALAYQMAALGNARHAPFQQAAIEQARWELERSPESDPQGTGALSLLVFHEYLGARWRAHADLQRERVWSFVSWVLRGRPTELSTEREFDRS